MKVNSSDDSYLRAFSVKMLAKSGCANYFLIFLLAKKKVSVQLKQL